MSELNHRLTRQRGLRNLLICCWTLHVLSVVSTDLWAADQTISRLPFQVRVVDEENRPVAGVKVRTHSLRMKVGQGTTFDWDSRQHGPPSSATTDSSGIARLVYPEWTANRVKTGAVDCSFEHPSYVSTRVAVRVDEVEGRIRLRRGIRLAVTATRGRSGKRIDHNLYGLLCGHQDQTEWKLFSNGTLVSRTIAPERDRLLVTHLPDVGLPLWSELLRPANMASGSRVMLRDVALTRGMRLTGHLADNVPRPVMNGYVIIVATQHTGMRDSARSMQWKDWAPIAADGHFEFVSLPRNGFVQLFAFCDGWNSASPLPEDLEKVGLAEFRAELQQPDWYPQVLRLRDGERSCEVPMNPSGRCHIRLVQADGEGVSGATVHAHPQQIWLSGDTEAAGTGFSMSRLMRQSAAQQKLFASSADDNSHEAPGVWIRSRHKHQQTTDDDGCVTIVDLPVARASEPGRHAFSAVMEIDTRTIQVEPVVCVVRSGQLSELTLHTPER